jgi:glycosyltransferase involved in cell wall biosynthesis
MDLKPDIRRVLCLAYDFPPLGGGAVARIHAFVKYLPRYGYLPRVITVGAAWHSGMLQDASLLQQYDPLVEIIRTPSLMPAGGMAQMLRADILGARRTPLPFSKWIKRILRVPYRWFVIPDETIFWFPFALWASWSQVRSWHPHVIFATTPWHGVGVIGAVLSRLTGLPFILDVRDDWVGNPFYQRSSRLRESIDRALERFVIRTAKRVIAVTPESQRLLQRKYSQHEPNFFQLIPNGFDPDSFSGLAEVNLPQALRALPRAQVRIVYSGSLPTKRSPEGFLRALQLLDPQFLLGKLDVIFVGAMRREFQDLIPTLGLENIVVYGGEQSQAVTLSLLQTADVGLAIIPAEEGGQTAIPAKVYEYLALNLYILALAEPESALGRLMHELGMGAIVPQHDAGAIAQCLRQLIDCSRYASLKSSLAPEVLNRFNRLEHTQKLATLLDKLT